MSTHFNFKQIVWNEPPECWVNSYEPARAYLHVEYGPLDVSFHEPEDIQAVIDVLAKGLADMERARAEAPAEDEGGPSQ